MPAPEAIITQDKEMASPLSRKTGLEMLLASASTPSDKSQNGVLIKLPETAEDLEQLKIHHGSAEISPYPSSAHGIESVRNASSKNSLYLNRDNNESSQSIPANLSSTKGHYNRISQKGRGNKGETTGNGNITEQDNSSIGMDALVLMIAVLVGIVVISVGTKASRALFDDLF